MLAESGQTLEVEGNQYFRRRPSSRSILNRKCLSHGLSVERHASYFDVEVNGERNHDAAWYYRDPKPAASQIKG